MELTGFSEGGDITEVTGILVANGHAPEYTFDVEFGEKEWEIKFTVIFHGGY